MRCQMVAQELNHSVVNHGCPQRSEALSLANGWSVVQHARGARSCPTERNPKEFATSPAPTLVRVSWPNVLEEHKITFVNS